MTCNNFLSLLSVSRRGRSSQQGGGVRRQENRKLDVIQTNTRGRTV